MKYKFIRISVLVLTLVILTACSAENDTNLTGNYDISKELIITSTIESNTNNTSEDNETSFTSQMMSMPNKFSLTPVHGSGNIVCEINHTYLVDNIFDEGIPLDEFNIDSSVQVGQGKEAKFYANPDFVDAETGQVVDGAYLIAVEMTVTNEDAATTHYVDNSMLPLGVTPSPESDEKAYVFRADYLTLYDNSRSGTEYVRGSFVWFSGYGQREEATPAFYLPVGKTTTMTIYYIIGEYTGNTLSSLGLSNELSVIGELPDIIYPLSLDETT